MLSISGDEIPISIQVLLDLLSDRVKEECPRLKITIDHGHVTVVPTYASCAICEQIIFDDEYVEYRMHLGCSQLPSYDLHYEPIDMDFEYSSEPTNSLPEIDSSSPDVDTSLLSFPVVDTSLLSSPSIDSSFPENTNQLLEITNHPLEISNHPLEISNHPLEITNHTNQPLEISSKVKEFDQKFKQAADKCRNRALPRISIEGSYKDQLSKLLSMLEESNPKRNGPHKRLYILAKMGEIIAQQLNLDIEEQADYFAKDPEQKKTKYARLRVANLLYELFPTKYELLLHTEQITYSNLNNMNNAEIKQLKQMVAFWSSSI
ncbi:9463_t:CDS:1 [Ambispora leptoticha]|uniref:9463_t:CDS:1 n=1 Tax=Ambispora leptoticha TaxID=144679 RepID=A0A9N9H960_9GLOM|nr:9463_t:CDS:1 [Ambispora leptoticha]